MVLGKSETRLVNVDYLRGMAAFGIMVYHYFSWSYGDYNASTFLGRVGIYGVSIFYILSGLTLFHVYNGKLNLPGELKRFYIKRFFRIYPLLWLATAGALVLRREWPPVEQLVLNFSGLFGIIRIDSYLAVGAWSIGNELVFYLFFPVFVFLDKNYSRTFIALCVVLLLVYMWFAFFMISPNVPLSLQFKTYINPLNQVFLFLGGYLLGRTLSHISFRQGTVIAMMVTSVCLFIFWPTSGDRAMLVYGVDRMVYTFVSLMLSLSFYKFKISLPLLIQRPLSLLGEASYSVYLLHPLLWGAVLFLVSHSPLAGIHKAFTIGGCMVLSVSISIFTYYFFEKKFMMMAGKIVSR